MEPAMFSVASMFDSNSGDDEDDAFVERDHDFPGVVLHIREFSFHQVNANLLWPGARIFADWIVEHQDLIKGRRVLELGSGTGALAIFLRKRYQMDITTSDYDDSDIEDNIKFNFHLNDIAPIPHIRHTWGEDFPDGNPAWDLIIASDILLYVKEYPNLIKTLSFLLKGHISKQNDKGMEMTSLSLSQQMTDSQALNKPSFPAGETPDCPKHKELSNCESETLKAGFTENQRGDQVTSPTTLPIPCFLMSWRRRIPKEDESLFFEGCKSAGFMVNDFGSRVYCIHLDSQSLNP